MPDLVIHIQGDAAQFTRTFNQVNSAIDRATGSTTNFGHSGVSSVQAISASLRVASGDFTGLLRASERFIAQSQALSTIAKGIFPAIGAIAIGSIFVRGAESAAKFVEQVNRIPEEVQQGYNSLNQSQRSANDALEVTNAQLELEIAKLEGAHGNILALQLAEARKEADDLASSLANAAKEQSELLEKNQNGVGAQLMGEGTTKYVYGNINNFNKLMAEAGRQREIALGNNDQEGADRALGRLHILQENALAYANENIAGRQREQDFTSPKTPLGLLRPIVGDQSANIDALTGFRDNVTLTQQHENDQRQNNVDTGVKRTDDQNKEDAEKRKQQQREAQEAARKAAEAARQAQEQVIQGWRSSLDELKAAQDLTLGQEANFWIDRAAFTTKGSKSYTTAIDEANKAIAQQVAQNGRASREFSDTAAKPIFAPDLATEDQGRIKEQSGVSIDFLKNLDEGVNIQRQNAQAIAEASLQQQVATGQMSTYDAAIVQAQLHTKEYTQQLDLLRDALVQVTGSDADAQKRRSDLNNQISALNGSRAIQTLQDNSAIDSQTLSGSIRETFDLYVQQATDTAAQVKQILTGAFDSVNQSLSTSLLAHATSGREYRRNIENSLGNSVRGVGSSILNSGFQQIEGGALKALGLGGGKKPTGAAGDPLHVVMDGGGVAGSTSNGIFGGLFNRLFGGRAARSALSNAQNSITGLSTDDSSDSALPDIASIPLQGFFANGGDVVANRPAIVGDGGKPEVFMPGTSGHIYPDASAFGSSTTNHYYSVDATGSTDPAAVQAAVDRSMRKYAPGIVQQSVKANREYQARRPLSKR